MKLKIKYRWINRIFGVSLVVLFGSLLAGGYMFWVQKRKVEALEKELSVLTKEKTEKETEIEDLAHLIDNNEKLKEEYEREREEYLDLLDEQHRKQDSIRKLEKQSAEKLISLKKEKSKTIYLTFDDGPTNNTLEILKILKEYDVKATFFVIGINSHWYQKIVEEGHQIAIHSYTHKYREIYASEEAFFEDLYKLRDKIKEETGVDAKIIRFPGGSNNKFISRDLMKQIIARLNSEGYVYQDWNCDSTDASEITPFVEDIVKNATNCYSKSINLLMHDAYAKTTTVQALPSIIEYYKNKGYQFDVLRKNSPKIQFVKE